MSDCAPFRLYLGDRVADVVRVVRSEMKRKGISPTGTDEAGTFSIPVPGGVVRATYKVDGKSFVITVQSRPSSLSCGAIESKMHDAMLDAKAALRNSPPD